MRTVSWHSVCSLHSVVSRAPRTRKKGSPGSSIVLSLKRSWLGSEEEGGEKSLVGRVNIEEGIGGTRARQSENYKENLGPPALPGCLRARLDFLPPGGRGGAGGECVLRHVCVYVEVCVCTLRCVCTPTSPCPVWPHGGLCWLRAGWE